MHADGGHPPAICIQGNVVDRDANCNGRGWRDDDVSFTLNTIDRAAVLYQPRSAMEENWEESGVKNALRAGESKSSHALVECYDARGNGDGETRPTITGDHENRITDYTAICVSGDDVADTLDASYYKGCGERGFKERTVVAVDCRNGTENADINGTLQAKSNGGMSLNLNNVIRSNRIVRRLTPLECERLQGYPDGWTDIGEWVDSRGKRHQTTDSARYKALGNSIALPYWRYLLKRISAQFEYTPTMASLFDGIGGFPYLWEGINGKGTCLWASEIEEFPMAVTKLRIGE